MRTLVRALLLSTTVPAIACGSSGGNGGPASDAGPGGGPLDGTVSSPAADGSTPSSSADGAGDTATSCGDGGGVAWSDPGIAAPVADPALAGGTHHYFAIHVVDSTSAPVVGATLTTTNQTVYTTDENGNVAYYEPGLMGTAVWFEPACTGYSYPADGFGNAGAALHPTEGGSGTITMTKTTTVTAPTVGNLQTRLLAGAVPGPAQCFAIRAVDSVTTRGVPLVKFAAAGIDAQWSDSQGMVAFCDPDLVGQSVAFTVTTDGYALASGTTVTLATTAGGSQTVSLAREYAGECLYRVTGQGIYRDSVLLGLKTPVANPDINGLVMGQDTPSTFVYGGTLWWLWQDTDQAAYALGNFDTSGATSALPGDGGLSPDLGSNQTYFVNSSGFSRGMVDTTADPNASSGSVAGIWLGQIVPVVDSQGQPQIFGNYYANTSSNPWNALAQLDATTSMFDYVADYPAGATIPGGRSNVVRDASGVSYAYWSNPVRFPATVAGVTDIASHEVFSALPGDGGTSFATNADGTLDYAWTVGAKPVTAAALSSAHVDADQGLDGHLTDIATGSGVQEANDSSMWNPYRGRFSKIVQQEYGTSFLGESWYVEGDTPLGPWVYARKVVTHNDGYTFYNPDIIPYFSEAGGRILFFNATYTASYTSLTPTPRYNYNEMMYRLDLDDPRLVLPVAVYATGSGATADLATKSGLRVGAPSAAAAFFAYDRPVAGAEPVAWSGASCGARRLTVGGQPATPPLFYAMPPQPSGTDAGAGPGLVALYEYSAPNGAYVYSVDSALGLTGFTRGAVVAWVLPSPIQVALPVADFLGDLVANAGPDQCVMATSGGTASVTLDASGSRDLAGAITEYTWKSSAAGCAIATGATASVSLPVGLNTVILQVTDAAGNVSTDPVLVDVAAP